MSSEVLRALLTIGFGALAGGVTNSIAIWMVFHPHEPPLLLGRWRLTSLQGAVPRSRARLASAIGHTVGGRLLTQEDLARTFADREFRAAFDERLSAFLSELLHTDRPSLRAWIPSRSRSDMEAMVELAVTRLTDRVLAYVASERFEEAVVTHTASLQDIVSGIPIGAGLGDDGSRRVGEAVDAWWRRVVAGPSFVASVDARLEQAADRLLTGDRTFEEILPRGWVLAAERALAGALPVAAGSLAGLLDDARTRARFEATVRAFLHRVLSDLRFHQRVMAKLLVTESTIQAILDAIEQEGSTRLSELLQEPHIQEAIARALDAAVREILRRPIHEVLGPPSSPRFAEGRRALSAWLVERARDPATAGILAETVRALLEPVGSRRWGELLEPLPPTLVSGAIVAVCRSEAGRAAVAGTLQRMAQLALDRDIGTPSDWLPEDGPERLERALGDPVWAWLQTQVPAVVDRIDVARTVEEKILAFPTEKMEELVRQVTERELRLIVRLGYVLGAVVGAALVLVQSLLA